MTHHTIQTIQRQTHHIDGEHAQRFSMLAAIAIVAQVFNLATGWLLPLVSEFSMISDNISELVLGRYGWLQIVAFLFYGVSTVGLAYALRPFVPSGWKSWSGLLLLTLNGLGLILVALFPTDRIDTAAQVWTQSTIGTIHLITSMISFLSIVISMLLFTWVFAGDARWRSRTIWSGLFASGAFALFLGQGEGPWVGLLQRLLVLLIAGWIILVAARIRELAQAEAEQ